MDASLASNALCLCDQWAPLARSSGSGHLLDRARSRIEGSLARGDARGAYAELRQLGAAMRELRLAAGGGTLGSFSDHTGDPAFMAAWNQVQSQLTSEGASSSDVDEAKNLFSSTVEQLYAQPGVDASKAIQGAQQLVMYGKTIAGAAAQIGGLVEAAQSGQVPPSQFVTAFTGTMIGLAVGAGALTAGVGAAIIAGVNILVGVLQQAGFFGGQTPGVEVCQGQGWSSSCNPPPSWTIGCTCVWQPGSPIVPGSPAWRHFPDPSSGADADWFDAGLGIFSWKGATFSFPTSKGRPIDTAFPPYHKLECDFQNAGTIAGATQSADAEELMLFLKAYFVAWKLNREYALNGLKVQDDWQVLVHTVRMWNKSHAPGAGHDFAYDASAAYLDPSSDCAHGGANFYVQSLVQDIINNNQSDVLNGSGAVHINTGPMLLELKPGVIRIAGRGGATPATSSTAAKAGVVLAGTAALGLVAWLALGRPMSWAAVKQAVHSL